MQITSRDPRRYELLILSENVADLEKSPKYVKFEQYRQIWLGLGNCTTSLQRWIFQSLMKSTEPDLTHDNELRSFRKCHGPAFREAFEDAERDLMRSAAELPNERRGAIHGRRAKAQRSNGRRGGLERSGARRVG
jgi:hypothetical protein